MSFMVKKIVWYYMRIVSTSISIVSIVTNNVNMNFVEITILSNKEDVAVIDI